MTRLHRSRIARITLIFLGLGLGFGWAGAQAVLQAPSLTTLPWMQIAVGCAIAAWGGGTATLGRYLGAQYDARPFLWRVEVLRDVVVSISVGAGAYLAGAWYGLGAFAIGIVLLLAGFLGVRLLSAAADRLLDAVRGPTHGDDG